MPGNLIKINDSDILEWYVGDSKMEDLIEHLDEIGIREKQEAVITTGKAKDLSL